MKQNETFAEIVASSPYILSSSKRYSSVDELEPEVPEASSAIMSLSNIRKSTEFYAISLIEGF